MKLSVIVSIFNEEHVIRLFYDELMLYVPREYEYEIVFVNDGSTDDSQKIISEIISENNHAKSILFSRNFGHEAAMLAGIDHATGDILICMDSDLQHPPALIPEMINRFRQGNVDVINMVRKKTQVFFQHFSIN